MIRSGNQGGTRWLHITVFGMFFGAWLLPEGRLNIIVHRKARPARKWCEARFYR